MSGPVDVLPIMDSAWVGATNQAKSDQMREARAAVAGLMETQRRLIEDFGRYENGALLVGARQLPVISDAMAALARCGDSK